MGAGTALQCIPIVAESRIPQQKSYLVALEGHTPQLSSYFPMLATTAPGSHLHRSAFGWWAHEPGTAVCGQWQGTGSWRAPWQSSLPCRRDKACWQRCCSRDKERIKSTLAQAVLKAQVPEHRDRNCCWRYLSTNQFLGKHSRRGSKSRKQKQELAGCSEGRCLFKAASAYINQAQKERLLFG